MHLSAAILLEADPALGYAACGGSFAFAAPASVSLQRRVSPRPQREEAGCT